MGENHRTFKLNKEMTTRQIELSLGDGCGRSVRLVDNPNIPVDFCAPFRLEIDHQSIGFFRDTQDVLEINSNYLSHNKKLLTDILAISQEVPT